MQIPPATPRRPLTLSDLSWDGRPAVGNRPVGRSVEQWIDQLDDVLARARVTYDQDVRASAAGRGALAAAWAFAGLALLATTSLLLGWLGPATASLGLEIGSGVAAGVAIGIGVPLVVGGVVARWGARGLRLTSLEIAREVDRVGGMRGALATLVESTTRTGAGAGDGVARPFLVAAAVRASQALAGRADERLIQGPLPPSARHAAGPGALLAALGVVVALLLATDYPVPRPFPGVEAFAFDGDPFAQPEPTPGADPPPSASADEPDQTPPAPPVAEDTPPPASTPSVDPDADDDESSGSEGEGEGEGEEAGDGGGTGEGQAEASTDGSSERDAPGNETEPGSSDSPEDADARPDANAAADPAGAAPPPSSPPPALPDEAESEGGGGAEEPDAREPGSNPEAAPDVPGDPVEIRPTASGPTSQTQEREAYGLDDGAVAADPRAARVSLQDLLSRAAAALEAGQRPPGVSGSELTFARALARRLRALFGARPEPAPGQ